MNNVLRSYLFVGLLPLSPTLTIDDHRQILNLPRFRENRFGSGTRPLGYGIITVQPTQSRMIGRIRR